MGIYSHYTDDELSALRTRLLASLHDRLAAPTAAASAGRRAEYQQRPDDIRREIEAVGEEIARRAGQLVRAPIYLV